MAEQEDNVPAADAGENQPQENGEGSSSDAAAKENSNEQQPSSAEDRVDLSKPLKKVDRPSREEFDAEMTSLGDEIEKLKGDRREIQQKIDTFMDSSRTSEVGKVREALSSLRGKKGSLINEKKAIRSRLDATRNQSERLFEDKKKTKESVRYTKVEDVEAEIQKLKRRQETTSMSLSEEKRLLKEMDALQASKKVVEQLKSKQIDLEDVKEQRKAISIEIAEKDKEIDAVQVEIEELSSKIKELSEKETGNRGQVQAFFAERDAIKKDLNDKHVERDELRKSFREANNQWYDYQRALRAQKKAQYEEEKQKREEERQEWLRLKEEEEMKKIPYEEEMALCDYLADYLTKTYLSDKGKSSADKDNGAKKKDFVEVKKEDDPFAGFKPMKKRDDDVYLKMGAGKKPRVRHSKKDKKMSKAAPFRLNVDTFEQFGLLSLVPPTSIDAVGSSVEALRAKKKWFSEQPRGSVPTATEIRKSNEKAAAQLRKRSEKEGGSETPTTHAQPSEGGSTKKKNGGNFSLSNDDFAPLSGEGATPSQSGAAPFNSSWGNKAAAESAPISTAEEETDGNEE